LKVIWQQDYDSTTNKSSFFGHLITAIILPDLRNNADKEWMNQRKNNIVTIVAGNIQ